jgi:HD-GYP domain-containing protein (c-di-GMP phosphodiesterase class II)
MVILKPNSLTRLYNLSVSLYNGYTMVRFNIDDVTEDMVLGESLFLPSGELLLAAGYRLKDPYRKRLKEFGFNSVFINVQGTESVIPETIISEHLQRETAVSLNSAAQNLKDTISIKKQGIQAVQEAITTNQHYLNKFIATTGIMRMVEHYVQEIINQPGIVLNLSEMKKSSGDLLTHSVNVTIISLCLGKKFRFSYEEMKQLGIGAINYDLGLVAVDPTILAKEDDFTDEEKGMYEQHTVFGYLMLSQNPAIPPTSSAVSLQHHEHQDGTGFPRGIKGENRPPLKDFSRKNVIHRFAEIVAVADVYDMLISGRPHCFGKHKVTEAIKRVIQMGGKSLNSEIVKTLVSIVPIYPVGARIRVINAPVAQLIGYIGVVARDNPLNLDQPQIILYETKNHQSIKPFLIDVAQHKGFTFELIT